VEGNEKVKLKETEVENIKTSYTSAIDKMKENLKKTLEEKQALEQEKIKIE
jgi:hypothetical protein